MIEEHPVSISALVSRHKFAIGTIFLACMLATAAFLAISKRTYRSEALIFVRAGGRALNLQNPAMIENLAVADAQQREVYAVSELLQSRLLAEKVVEQFGANEISEIKPSHKYRLKLSELLSGMNDYNLNPFQKFSDRDEAIKAFQKNFKVMPSKASNVIPLSYSCKNSKSAQKILAFHLKSATDEHFRIHRTAGSEEFFAKQAEILRTKLCELELRLKDMKNKTGLVSLELQRARKLDLIGTLDQDLVMSLAQLDSSEAEAQKRRSQLADINPEIVTQRTTDQPNGIGQALRSKLYDIQTQEMERVTKLGKDHPLAISTRERTEEAKKMVDVEKQSVELTMGVNPNFQAVELAVRDREASAEGLRKRIESLTDKLASSRSEIVELNSAELDFSELQREIDLARTNYRTYAENLEQARINEELEQAKLSGLSIMQPPTLSQTPVKPDPLFTLAIGFALACFSSMALVTLLEYRGFGIPASMDVPNRMPESHVIRGEVA